METWPCRPSLTGGEGRLTEARGKVLGISIIPGIFTCLGKFRVSNLIRALDKNFSLVVRSGCGWAFSLKALLVAYDTHYWTSGWRQSYLQCA